MRVCGQCGEKFVDCLARREEHYKYECSEGRSAWNASRIAEGRATKKKEIREAKGKFHHYKKIEKIFFVSKY